MTPVLVDTGPLVALHDEHDNLHDRAVEDLSRIKGPRLVCLPVLTETVHLLDSPIHVKRLEASIERDVVRLGLPVRWEEVVATAFRWMDRYHEHEPDFTDAFLVAWVDADPSMAIWTFDKEFRNLWRTPSGKRPRMAAR